MAKASISGIYKTGNDLSPVYSPNNGNFMPNPYQMDLPHDQSENINWLLG
jgi:hypothetical protein